MNEKVKRGDVYSYNGVSDDYHTFTKYYTVIDAIPDEYGEIAITCDLEQEYILDIDSLNRFFIKVTDPSILIEELFSKIK